MKYKKILSTLLISTMIIGNYTSVFASQRFSDFPNDWSTEALNYAVDNNIIVGDNGKINPSGYITRSQVAAIIVRAFGGTDKFSSLDNFKDVYKDAWYYDSLSKAFSMNIISGYGNSIMPDKEVTRQEAFSIIARAFCFDTKDLTVIEKFNDSDKIADWAKKDIAALAEKGYVNGSNGNINPESNMTRAEFAQIMYNIVSMYINENGEYTELKNGNIIISSDNVVLKNTEVKGDIILADGISDGKVIFDGVTISGNIIIRGGSLLEIKSNSSTSNIIVNNTNSKCEINIEKGSSTGDIICNSETNITGEGTKGNVIDNLKIIENNDTPLSKNPETNSNKISSSNSSSGNSSSGSSNSSGGSSSSGGNSSNNGSQSESDFVVKKSTKIVDLGWIQYVVVSFKNGCIDDYTLKVDGKTINATKVDDKGTIVKWEIENLNHKELTVTDKSGNTQTIKLN